ncbi:MAG: hypothetical protein KGV51_08565 [Moraxellaceae bacterium]|nr:hypothetical protein [Moraxellaceae bacterium]
MKLFSVKTLSTVTMLSTAVLLSACWSCGGSDSSGSDNNTVKIDTPKSEKTNPPKAESNSSGSQKEKDKQKEQSKKDNYSLIGYWKSKCITEDIASPTIVYYHITETKNNEPKKAVEVVQEFKGKNCTGTSEVSYRDASDWGADEEDKLSIKFSNKDNWQLVQTDSINKKVIKTDFTRSSANEFNKVKNQGKQDELPTEKTIIDKLNGYWKSNCTTKGKFKGKYKSTIIYMNFQKINDDKLKGVAMSKEFTTTDCTGNYFVKSAKKILTLTKADIEKAKDFKLIDNNHWKDTDDNLNFVRITKNEFKKIKSESEER